MPDGMLEPFVWHLRLQRDKALPARLRGRKYTTKTAWGSPSPGDLTIFLQVASVANRSAQTAAQGANESNRDFSPFDKRLHSFISIINYAGQKGAQRRTGQRLKSRSSSLYGQLTVMA